jgi:hypothetical protein
MYLFILVVLGFELRALCLLGRQVLYCLSHSSSPVLYWVFSLFPNFFIRMYLLYGEGNGPHCLSRLNPYPPALGILEVGSHKLFSQAGFEPQSDLCLLSI